FSLQIASGWVDVRLTRNPFQLHVVDEDLEALVGLFAEPSPERVDCADRGRLRRRQAFEKVDPPPMLVAACRRPGGAMEDCKHDGSETRPDDTVRAACSRMVMRCHASPVPTHRALTF